jgi:NADH:ubiquinone reductase (H+-translocating)
MIAWAFVGAGLLLLALAVWRAGRRMVAAPMVPAHAEFERAAGRRRKRIVILGGGFGGVYAARALQKALGRRDDFEVVLVNQENYFVFQPMLPEVISGTIGLVDIVNPIRRLLPHTEVHVRQVQGIDLERRIVLTSPGIDPRPHEIEFDHLVLAMGTATDFRGMRGLPEHALPFKNLADALALRNHVIHVLEEAAIEAKQPQLVDQLLTFVIAGGGFSGVEVAAELNDFVRAVARSYRGVDGSRIRVILLHALDRILPELSPPLAQFAHDKLVERGVEIRLNVRLEAASSEAAILVGGERIATRTVVSTVPASPHPVIEALPLAKTRNGRLQVNSYLQVQDAVGVWALGDCAYQLAPDGSAVPPTAQHAIRQAQTLANNIVAALRGGAPQAFAFRGLGKMCSLGNRSAVAEIGGVKLSGFFAWFLWRTIYLMKLPSWSRRIKVAASWTMDLFLPPDLIQLQLSKSPGITRAHFEPGQLVLRQGDLGDRMYIVISGEAEIMQQAADGAARAVARVGAGEYLGELALLAQGRRNASVRCVQAMDVLSVPKREFALLTEHLQDLRGSLLRAAQQRAAGAPDGSTGDATRPGLA